jgi:hypothetical protein
MLRRLLGKLGPKRRTDPLFGELVFLRMPDASRSYWQGGGMFPPTRKEIDYFIDAGEAGPVEAQRGFYRELMGRYGPILSSVLPLLEREWARWGERDDPEDAAAAFNLSSLSVPRCESADEPWELTYICSHGPHVLLSVQMMGWTPTGIVTVDG